MRLLVRGGSIPAGHGVARGYADILRDALAPRGVEVLNRSRFRETSFDGIGTFHEDVLPFRPDLLLIHFGMDDAFGAVYRSEFKENLVRMVRLARERFDPLILLPTAHVLPGPCDMEAAEIFYRAVREVAVDLGCRFIPVHTFWAGFLRETGLRHSDLLQSDPRWPNEKGHEVLARAILPAIR
jgi:lysophospholipase L1-like esterase